MLIWAGIALNILASLINIYEKINNSILKKLYLDIDKIKKGNYLVETQLIDIEENDKEASNNITSNNTNSNNTGNNINNN
jgi:hypothetical protein